MRKSSGRSDRHRVRARRRRLRRPRKLGLDLTSVNAEGAVRLRRATVLVVNQDRNVRFVDVQPDYTARTEVAEIIAALTDLT